MNNILSRPTKIGIITITETDDAITSVSFGEADDTNTQTESAILTEAFAQLERYLDGDLTTFGLPLKPAGTDFMQKVWHALTEIPFGTVRSYKDIAETIGHPKAYRAVGLANNRNPIPIFIPCHRVIGANGDLVGYGSGLHIKQALLTLEGSI